MPTYGLKVELDTDNSVVVVNVVDRDNDNEVIDTRAYEIGRVHQSLVKNVALYGLSKLIQDRTSDQSVKEHGKAKLDAMEDVLARLEQGEWGAERKAGAPTVSVEVEALAQVKGMPVGAIQKALRNYSKEQRELIFANPSVVAAVAEIKASREAAGEINLDSML